jgi:outer membrane protein OmpA-like peptidoglycan-associated protein
MRKFISTTSALAILLASGPTMPLMAQDFAQAEIDGQIVLCLPKKLTECPEGALCTVEKDPDQCKEAAKKFLKALNKDQAEPEAVVDVAELDVAAPTEAILADDVVLAFEPFKVKVDGQAVICLPDKSVPCPEGKICTVSADKDKCEKKAAKILASMEPVDVVEPDKKNVEALDVILDDPKASNGDTVKAAASKKADKDKKKRLPSEEETSKDAAVTEEVLTEDDTRSASEEFDAAPTAVAPGKKSGLSNLEIAGLAILGTLAVGAILKNNKRVVENTGDRVVVEDANGNVSVYKDDNALLREPGTNVRTETFADGSTRTVMVRPDGTQIVTIRDGTGRVLQRSAYTAAGVETALIDDLTPERKVDYAALPKPKKSTSISDSMTMGDIREELKVVSRADYAHAFSLRQVREKRRVRDLAPTIDINNVTFDSGSSAIKKTEARKLKRLGRMMKALIEKNPGEMFLVEGHTDAVGRAGYNLALSDRRAESVARALTEYYGVPSQNLVVQGYGEKELKIVTKSDERKNRRAVVRIITPLLKVSAR